MGDAEDCDNPNDVIDLVEDSIRSDPSGVGALKFVPERFPDALRTFRQGTGNERDHRIEGLGGKSIERASSG